MGDPLTHCVVHSAAYERNDQSAESITLSRVNTAFDYVGGMGAFGTPQQLASKLAPNGTIVSAEQDRNSALYRIEAFTDGRHCFFALGLKQRPDTSSAPLFVTLTASIPEDADSDELSSTLRQVASSFQLE